MVLADTSIWVDHLRATDPHLFSLLEQGRVCLHPWILGELACGNLHRRKQLMNEFWSMPMAPVIATEEVVHCVENHRLMGKGIGFIDAQLIASALVGNLRLWTRDKKLAALLAPLNILYRSAHHQ